MKKLAAIAALILLLAGCGKDPALPRPAEPAAKITEVKHKLADGRTVTCLLWDADAGYDSGMSCDWANATK